MKNLNPIFYLLFSAVIFTACHKKENITPSKSKTKDTDVYISGYIHTAAAQFDIATYWKNGTVVNLSDGTTFTHTTGIGVSGSNVCVSGFRTYVGGNSVAMYWKNGVAVDLTDGSTNAQATGIAITGNDVYVSGFVGNKAVYWKNGIVISLTDGSSSAEATAITISGSDVYVAGYNMPAEGMSVAIYWKNGIAVNFTLNYGNYAQATAIAVSGNDVYVAGYAYIYGTFYEQTGQQTRVAAYWKNGGIGFSLSDGNNDASATGIAVSGNGIYVAGYTSSYVCYWENGAATNLTYEFDGQTAAIAVLGNDVYAASTAGSMAVYWKNRTSIRLSSVYSAATGITIQY